MEPRYSPKKIDNLNYCVPMGFSTKSSSETLKLVSSCFFLTFCLD